MDKHLIYKGMKSEKKIVDKLIEQMAKWMNRQIND